MRTRKMAKINGIIMVLLTFFTCYFFKLPFAKKKLSYEKPSQKDFNITLTLITKDEVIKKDGIQHKEWCHRCVNYIQYEGLIYPDGSSDTYLDMVMFTQTYYTEDFFQRRRFFRKYMLNHTNFPTLTVKHMFVFGICHDCNLTQLSQEAKLYNDILVFNFVDTYKNLTIKTLVSLNWIYQHYNTDIVIRSNDDTIFNVTDIHRTVWKHVSEQTGSKQTGSPAGSKQTGSKAGSKQTRSKVILASCSTSYRPIRDLNNKWGVSVDVYPYKTYPMLCSGVCILFTKPAIKSLLDQTNNTPLLHMDDVSIGLLAKAAGDIKFVECFQLAVQSAQTSNTIEEVSCNPYSCCKSQGHGNSVEVLKHHYYGPTLV